MSVKFYWIIAVFTVSLSSCLKQSIADAMQDSPETKKITAILSYEINGSKVNVTVADADRQVAGSRRLSCEKSNGFVLSAVIDNGDFVFTFFTDSLRMGNYKYLGSYGPSYVTTFQGRAQYVYAASDNMNFNITNNTNGHISGNFTGKLTPYINPAYGATGSVIITNGSFTNIPVFY
jgi:hypothetical protein